MGVDGECIMRGVLGCAHDGDGGGKNSLEWLGDAERRRADPGGDGGGRSKRRCDGDRERERRPLADGGAANVADLWGICSLGRFAFRRSADVVSNLRKVGTLGRRGGGGEKEAVSPVAVARGGLSSPGGE